jgi:hypothetical protein
MRALLLGLAAPVAALTLAASPAAALDPAGPVFVGGSAHGVTVHHGLPPGFSGNGWHDGPRHDGDRRRRHSDAVFIYDRDYQGDTAWRANSYNDWWHERTERSYPRWMASNQDCQRLWWSGGGWRC